MWWSVAEASLRPEAARTIEEEGVKEVSEGPDTHWISKINSLECKRSMPLPAITIFVCTHPRTELTQMHTNTHSHKLAHAHTHTNACTTHTYSGLVFQNLIALPFLCRLLWPARASENCEALKQYKYITEHWCHHLSPVGRKCSNAVITLQRAVSRYLAETQGQTLSNRACLSFSVCLIFFLFFFLSRLLSLSSCLFIHFLDDDVM